MLGILPLLVAIMLLVAVPAYAHCDTMDGPVIADAKLALESGDITPILKWVSSENEAELRAAFEHTLAVRALGDEARELADNYLFETLVRIHREGEGAPYTGIKPHGTPLEPGITEADQAIAEGNPDAVFQGLHAILAEGIADRLSRVIEAKKHVNDSVEAGREYVEAYVIFVHYIERLFADAGGDAAHGETGGGGAEPPAEHSTHAH